MTRIDLKTSKSIRLRTKGKYVAEDIDIVPNLETINVTPTTAEQNFSVGSGFSGIGKVNVDAIQTEQTTIKTNGTHTPSAGKFFDKVVVDVADIPAVLQEKSVTPTRQPQTVLPDTNYEGMSKVEVGGIPAEFIVPSGSITATENKTYDVTEVKQVVVAVPEKADAKLIEGSATKNGEYWAKDYGADGFEVFTVNVEEKYKEPEGSMLIEANGDYDVKDLAEVQVRVPEKEDLDAELQAQDEALTELEDAVNNLPDKSEGTGGVAVNVVGAWTINPDGSANTETGVYYNFTHDGKVQVVALGNVTDLGTYIIDGNVVNITGDAGNQTWYYNEDGGIGVEENGESMMWRLVPQGTLEVKENGDYDVTPNTKVNVNVPIPEGYIIPEGELEITENNKQFDVTDKKTVFVNVPTSGGSGGGTGDLVEQNRQFAMAKDLQNYISAGKAFDESVYNDTQLQYIQDILNYIVRGETV